jgi:hypothetical protein
MSIVCSEEEINTYRQIVDFSIGCNPRSMKRLFNSFILLNTVAGKKGMFNEADGIKAKDKQRILFAALCLQMAFEEIYEFMIKNKNDLNADLFNGIKELEKLKTDSVLEEIRKNIPVKEDLYYSKIADFMELFYNCLQLDDDPSLSSDELKNLKNILSFSVITANTREEIQPQRDMGAIYSEFWKQFLEKIKGRSILYQKNKGSNSPFLNTNSKINGLVYSVAIANKYARCSLWMNLETKDKTKSVFDVLEKSKADIERRTGKTWEWKRNDHQKTSSIDSTLTGVSISNKGDWPKMIDFLIEEINIMENSFGIPLETLSKTEI